MQVTWLPIYGLVSTGSPSATVELSLKSQHAFRFKPHRPSACPYRRVSFPSAGIQPQTALRPTASGSG